MHLDDETIQRWIHGELDPDAKRTVSAHLAECADCRNRLAEAELEDQWIRRRFQLMDHSVPAASPSAIFRARRSSQRLRWAAGIVLTCAVAGAAYATPGSPLPRWLRQARVWVSGSRPSVPTVRTPPAVTSGISVPIEPRLVIRFAAPQNSGVLRVTLVDTGSVAIRVTNGMASLSSAPGVLGVENRGSLADYEIDLPRTSPWVEIDLAGQTLLQKRDGVIRTEVTVDSAGHYLLRLTPLPDR